MSDKKFLRESLIFKIFIYLFWVSAKIFILKERVKLYKKEIHTQKMLNDTHRHVLGVASSNLARYQMSPAPLDSANSCKIIII